MLRSGEVFEERAGQMFYSDTVTTRVDCHLRKSTIAPYYKNMCSANLPLSRGVCLGGGGYEM